jgi:hypothetical protein
VTDVTIRSGLIHVQNRKLEWEDFSMRNGDGDGVGPSSDNLLRLINVPRQKQLRSELRERY